MSVAAENRKLLVKLTVIALGMFGFGFALVPFYKAICDVTGLNNLMNADRAPVNTQVDMTRAVRFEFDANSTGSTVRLTPVQRSVDMHPGEMKLVEFEVANLSDVPVVGQAIPSYAPRAAADLTLTICWLRRPHSWRPGHSHSRLHLHR